VTRRVRLVAVVALAALALVACNRRDTFLDEVLDAVDSARQQAATFVYTDLRPDGTLRVQGVIEDDFRYKAAVEIDGTPAYEQIVFDDTLAVRFLDPAHLRSVLSARATEADLSTELEGFTALDVLRSGRWVLDDSGAPLVSAISTAVGDLGRDPVLDAVTALDYVAEAASRSISVERWSDDSLDPTYPTSEDDFPRPEDGSGVTRYDLRRPDLPAISENTGDVGGIGLPGVAHFRKMAIYVKDGRIIEVREEIEATGRRLEQFLDYSRAAIDVFSFDATFKEQFETAVAAAVTEQDLADVLFAGINTAIVSLGQDPITRRSMVLSLIEGDRLPVALPGADLVAGSLAVLATSAEGQAAFLEAEEEGRAVDLTAADDDTGGPPGAPAGDGADPGADDPEQGSDPDGGPDPDSG